jgi:hypothetical protein
MNYLSVEKVAAQRAELLKTLDFHVPRGCQGETGREDLNKAAGKYNGKVVRRGSYTKVSMARKKGRREERMKRDAWGGFIQGLDGEEEGEAGGKDEA